MRYLTPLLALLALPVAADVNLPLVCDQPAYEGRTAGQTPYCAPLRYRTARPTDLVYTRAAPDTPWGSYVWRRWSALAPGSEYQVCTSDVPQGATTGCTAWTFRRTPLATGSDGVVRLSWGTVTQNTDGTPVVQPVRYRIYRRPATGTAAVRLLETTAIGVDLTRQPAGEQCYFATTLDGAGVESVPSADGCKLFVLAPPSGGSIERPTDGSIER